MHQALQLMFTWDWGMMFSTGSELPEVTGSTDALFATTALHLGGRAALGPWTCENLSLVLLLTAKDISLPVSHRSC